MIKEFENKQEFDKFINPITNSRFFLDIGGEGSCYIKNDLVYKVISEDCINFYNISDIILDNDYNLKHFVFPIDIYCNKEKNELYGYTTRYIKNNLFNIYGILDDINLDKLVYEYNDMLKDVEVLSKDHIFLFDLPANLIFNNQELVAIDTIAYTKEISNVINQNKKQMLSAIKLVFYFFLDLNEEVNNKKSFEGVMKLARTMQNSVNY